MRRFPCVSLKAGLPGFGEVTRSVNDIKETSLQKPKSGRKENRGNIKEKESKRGFEGGNLLPGGGKSSDDKSQDSAKREGNLDGPKTPYRKLREAFVKEKAEAVFFRAPALKKNVCKGRIFQFHRKKSKTRGVKERLECTRRGRARKAKRQGNLRFKFN